MGWQCESLQYSGRAEQSVSTRQRGSSWQIFVAQSKPGGQVARGEGPALRYWGRTRRVDGTGLVLEATARGGARAVLARGAVGLRGAPRAGARAGLADEARRRTADRSSSCRRQVALHGTRRAAKATRGSTPGAQSVALGARRLAHALDRPRNAGQPGSQLAEVHAGGRHALPLPAGLVGGTGRVRAAPAAALRAGEALGAVGGLGALGTRRRRSPRRTPGGCRTRCRRGTSAHTRHSGNGRQDSRRPCRMASSRPGGHGGEHCQQHNGNKSPGHPALRGESSGVRALHGVGRPAWLVGS